MELLILLIFFHLILDISSQNQKPRLSVAKDDDELTFACEILKSESETADFSCNLYIGENLQHYPQQVSRKKSNSMGRVCRFTALRSEVFNRLQSLNKYEASCDYSLTSNSTARSPMSDKYPLTRFFFTLTHPSTTEKYAANVPQPRLSTSREILSERGSVQLHCEVPHHVKASQCFFYPEGQEASTKLAASCQMSVTGSELITWAARRSPGKLHIICYYTVDKSVRQTPSLHSHRAPVTVLNQKPRLSVYYAQQDQFIFLCEILASESVTSEISCSLYTGENPQPYLKTVYRDRKSGNTVCTFAAHRNDMFNRLQSVKICEVSCDYSLNSDSTARSSMSNKRSLTQFFPKTTQLPTTKKSTTDLRRGTTPTSGPTVQFIPPTTARLITTKHPTTHLTSVDVSTSSSTTMNKLISGSQILRLSILSVCVSLAGIICFCLCCFIKKRKAQRRKVDMTHGDEGVIASMLNSNLSGLDIAINYSLINSVPLSSIPLDPSGDKKKDSKTAEDDVYHMYCSIADTQPVTRHKDKVVYNLVQPHCRTAAR